MREIDWYFDPISPYAYLALAELHTLAPLARIRLRPVLFAGLLGHWDNVGPAEIPPKRVWTYRFCAWQAAQKGIPFVCPAAHPFNPLPWLRLATVLDGEESAVRRIFEAIWATGEDAGDASRAHALARELGVDPLTLNDPAIKQRLRAETDAATARGVFGVPSLVIDGNVFWGADALDFARAFLLDPDLLQKQGLQLRDVPIGAVRRGR
jgi:2-hydroxychromene-2-carboxylate isomerase